MRAAGALVTVNTDDPALTDLDLARECAAGAAAWNWSWDQMVDLALDGVEASWLDDSVSARCPPGSGPRPCGYGQRAQPRGELVIDAAATARQAAAVR